MSVGVRTALPFGYDVCCRRCVRRVIFGSVGVLMLRASIATFVVVVVVLTRPVAMEDPTRDGKRENSGGVPTPRRALPLPPVGSLYLRGELPWYAVGSRCAGLVANGFGSGIEGLLSFAWFRGGVGDVSGACTANS
jgi:hypothetical protein